MRRRRGCAAEAFFVGVNQTVLLLRGDREMGGVDDGFAGVEVDAVGADGPAFVRLGDREVTHEIVHVTGDDGFIDLVAFGGGRADVFGDPGTA